MKDLIDKLSSYNIFNYLLPGILFAALGSRLTGFPLLEENMLIGVFLYYFYGLVISRVGSLLVESFLKKIGYVSHVSYEKYVSASKADEQIIGLSEVNNMYRTLISLFMCLLIIMLCEAVCNRLGLTAWGSSFATLIFLTLLFVVSYKKQSAYVVARVRAVTKTN